MAERYKRYVMLPSGLARDRRLTKAAPAVLIELAEYANRDKQAWPAIASLAARTGFSESTVQRAINSAVLAGVLTKKATTKDTGGNGSNVYTFNSGYAPPDMPDMPDTGTSGVSPMTPCQPDQGVTGATPGGVKTGDSGVSPVLPKQASSNNHESEPANARERAREVAGVLKFEGSAGKRPEHDPMVDDPMLGDWLLWAGVDDCPKDNLTRMAGELYQALDHGLGNSNQRDKIKNFAQMLNQGRPLSPDQAKALRAIHAQLSEGPDGLVSIACHQIRRRFPGWSQQVATRPNGALLIAAAKRRDIRAIERLLMVPPVMQAAQ